MLTEPAKSRSLTGMKALVVVHGDDQVVMALHGFDEDRIRWERPGGVDTMLPRA